MGPVIDPATPKAILADQHLIIDVRRQADRNASSESIPGVTWLIPRNWVNGRSAWRVFSRE